MSRCWCSRRPFSAEVEVTSYSRQRSQWIPSRSFQWLPQVATCIITPIITENDHHHQQGTRTLAWCLGSKGWLLVNSPPTQATHPHRCWRSSSRMTTMVIVTRVLAMILLINLTLNLPYPVDGGLPHGRGRPSAPYFPSQVHQRRILFVLDMKFSIKNLDSKWMKTQWQWRWHRKWRWWQRWW